MKRITYILLLLLLFTKARGQEIVGYEYWFDANRQDVVYVAGSLKDITLSIDISQQRQGMHYFNFRAKDSNGKWSAPLTQYFYRLKEDDRTNLNLSGCEYWFDDDFVNRTTVANTDGVIALDIDASKLRPGMHFLNFRAKNKGGHYSSLTTQYFYRLIEDDRTNLNLSGYEYWIDDDSANRTEVAHTDGVIALDIDISKLRPGIHFLNFRAKNKGGHYSNLTTQYFYRLMEDDPTNLNLAGYEYWMDDDYANRTEAANTDGIVALDIDASALRPGMHYFNFRAKNKGGRYSNLTTQYFYRLIEDDRTNLNLAGYEYWLDDDFANRIEVANTDGIVTLDVDASALRPGMHYFNFRAKNKGGYYGSLTTQYFYRLNTDDRANLNLAGYEYWLDDDFENRVEVANTDGLIVFDLDASTLRKGMHYLNFRAKNVRGDYSTVTTQYFMKPFIGIADNKICQYRYWFDEDYTTVQTVDITPVNPLEWEGMWIEFPNLVPEELPEDILFTPAAGTTQAFYIPQETRFYLQFKDFNDEWTATERDTVKHNARIEVSPQALTMNKGVTVKKPAPRQLSAFSVDVTKEDSIYWKTDQPCRIMLFSPEGKRLKTFSLEESITGKRIKTPDKGRYYALLYNAARGESYPKEDLTLICIGTSLSDTIEVNPAGTLPELVGDPEIVENLTLTGYLNGTDIRFIRSLPRLAKLDISGAHIVAGGTTYYKEYRTADEVTGDYMFCDLPRLTRLVLSGTTTTLGERALSGCTGLTELSIPATVTTIGQKAIGGTEGNLLLVHWNTSAAISSGAFDAPEAMGNCLIYAPEGVESTYEGNVIIGSVAERIRLTHAKGFRCTEPFKAKEITYTRSFSMTSGNKDAAAGWESIVLPFDVQTFGHAEKGELAPFNSGKQGTRPFWLAQLTPDAGFAHVTELKANTPYIISMPNSDSYEEEFNIRGDVTFHAESEAGVDVQVTKPSALVRSEGPEFTLVPAYETVWQHDTVYVVNRTISNGNLPGGAFVRNLRNAEPFEAYVVTKQSPQQAPMFFSIGGGGELTGLETLLRRADDSLKVYSIGRTLYVETDRPRTLPVYDTEGRMVRIADLPEGKSTITDLLDGIYFLGGKKVMIGK